MSVLSDDQVERVIKSVVDRAGAGGIDEVEIINALNAFTEFSVHGSLVNLFNAGKLTVGWDSLSEDLLWGLV